MFCFSVYLTEYIYRVNETGTLVWRQRQAGGGSAVVLRRGQRGHLRRGRAHASDGTEPARERWRGRASVKKGKSGARL